MKRSKKKRRNNTENVHWPGAFTKETRYCKRDKSAWFLQRVVVATFSVTTKITDAKEGEEGADAVFFEQTRPIHHPPPIVHEWKLSYTRRKEKSTGALTTIQLTKEASDIQPVALYCVPFDVMRAEENWKVKKYSCKEERESDYIHTRGLIWHLIRLIRQRPSYRPGWKRCRNKAARNQSHDVALKLMKRPNYKMNKCHFLSSSPLLMWHVVLCRNGALSLYG